MENIDITNLLNADIGYSETKTPIDAIIKRMEWGSYFRDTKKKCRLEEKQVIALVVSLLKNIPIPNIYMHYVSEDYKYNIINGQRTLINLFFFVKGVFPISENKWFCYKFDEIGKLTDMYRDVKSKKQKEEIETQLKDNFGLEFKEFSYLDSNKKKNIFSYQSFSDETKRHFGNKTLNITAVNIRDDYNSTYLDVFKLLNKVL